MATVTIYGGTADNVVRSVHATLATAQGSGGTLDIFSASGATLESGQYDAAGNYYVLEGMISFDSTGSLVASDTITAATFSLKKSSATDDPGTIEIRLYDWGADVGTADWVTAANLGSQTLLASGNPNATGVGSYFDFTDTAGPANVVKNGVTRLIVNAANHRTGATPTASPAVPVFKFYSADEAGTTSDPKLVVVYTPAAGGAFLMAGD